MKRTYNNTQLLLLLFISLLPLTQNFAQNNNKEKVDINLRTTDSYLSLDAVNTVVIDGVDISLVKTEKGDFRRQRNGEAIIRNTSSELGNSFYNLFSEFNRSEGITYPYVINIGEKTLLGCMNYEICILVNNKLIYKFRALANNKYLTAAAQETNKQLKKHFTDERLYAVE